MQEINLKFYGYTWEDYAFLISSLRGVFVIYKGNLDYEGAVALKDILYVGYHHGIYEMYDEGIMNQIKEYVDVNDRLFLSYAEVSEEEKGKEIEAFLRKTIKPRFSVEELTKPSGTHIICDGACALFPKEILSKES
jgi:hypothetical protein